MANPKLWSGTGSPQSIYAPGTTQYHPVGSRAGLDDGRAFYYARYSGAAILVAGHIAMSELGSVDWDDLATNTAVAGDKSVTVTAVGTKEYAANELAGGYIHINSGTTAQGVGMTYKIAGHDASTGAAADMPLTLVDEIAVTFNADNTATVQKNPWMDPVVAAAGTAHTVVGVAPIDIAIGSTTPQYAWLQTWGMAAVAYDITEVAGAAQASGATTPGEIQDAAGTQQVVGVNYFASLAGDWCPTFLTIAP